MSVQQEQHGMKRKENGNENVLGSNHINLLGDACRQEVKDFCQQLSLLSLENFLMRLQFNDGSVCCLASQKDLEITCHYDVSELSKSFKENSIFYSIRHSPECNFVFAATWAEGAVADIFFRKKWLNQFDDFCISFVEKFKPIILSHHVNYRDAYVFNSTIHLTEIIKNKGTSNQSLTPREKQCLLAAMDGLSTKETAKKLGISYTTVRGYLEAVRGKLSSSTIAEAVGRALYQGKIGRIFPENFSQVVNNWHTEVRDSPKKMGKS